MTRKEDEVGKGSSGIGVLVIVGGFDFSFSFSYKCTYGYHTSGVKPPPPTVLHADEVLPPSLLREWLVGERKRRRGKRKKILWV